MHIPYIGLQIKSKHAIVGELPIKEVPSSTLATPAGHTQHQKQAGDAPWMIPHAKAFTDNTVRAFLLTLSRRLAALSEKKNHPA